MYNIYLINGKTLEKSFNCSLEYQVAYSVMIEAPYFMKILTEINISRS